jgi:predicted NAD-dependent protein-ADP-ribosyltransferase YbiA (DUF1768 family)/uncharacterized protein (DUF1810 family)
MSDIKLDSGLLLDIRMYHGKKLFLTAIKFYKSDELYNCFANTFHTESINGNPGLQLKYQEKKDGNIIEKNESGRVDMFNIIIPYKSGNITYKTAEHYYQAGKAHTLEDYNKILELWSGRGTQFCISCKDTPCKDMKTGTPYGDIGLNIQHEYYENYWDSSKTDGGNDGKKPGLPALEQPDWWTDYHHDKAEYRILPVNNRFEMDYKCGRMFNGLLFKYGMNNDSSKKLREILIGTGWRILIEHTIHDGVWGDCKGVTHSHPNATDDHEGIYYQCNPSKPTECDGDVRSNGCNYLGRMLMVIRHILLKNPDKYIDRDKDFYDTFFIKGVHVPDTLWKGGGARLGDPTFNFTTGTPPSASRPNLSQTPNKPLPKSIQNILRAQNGWGNKPTYDAVVKEMTPSHGSVAKKEGHWMWYIFPQFLAYRPNNGIKMYSIENLADFETYLLHPLLNERLQRITQIITPSLSTDLSKLKTLFGDTSDTNNTDTIKFKQAMLTYIIVYCNLIVKSNGFTQAHKDMIEGSIDTCFNALIKMGVTKLNGNLEGDGDRYEESNFFLKILKKDIGLEPGINSQINTEQTIDRFKQVYLNQLKNKGVIEAIEQELAVEPIRRDSSRRRQPRLQSRPQSRLQPRRQPSDERIEAVRHSSSLPYYRVNSTPNKFILRLVGNLSDVTNRDEFKDKCRNDVAQLLSIGLSRVTITSLQNGSIKVYIEIRNHNRDSIVTDDTINELLRDQSISDRDVDDIHITHRPVLKHSERMALQQHIQDNRECNKIHLEIGQQLPFDIKKIKTVISKKSNDYVFAYNLNIVGLEEINYKEKTSVLNRFLDS